MTRDEAIKWIKKLISEMKKETSGNYPDPEYRDEVYKALDMAISDMEQIEDLKTELKSSEKLLSAYNDTINHRQDKCQKLEAENKRLKDGIAEIYKLLTSK